MLDRDAEGRHAARAILSHEAANNSVLSVELNARLISATCELGRREHDTDGIYEAYAVHREDARTCARRHRIERDSRSDRPGSCSLSGWSGRQSLGLRLSNWRCGPGAILASRGDLPHDYTHESDCCPNRR